MKLIILEGADLVGKSTLAQDLAERNPDSCVTHFPAPPENLQGNVMDYWRTFIRKSLSDNILTPNTLHIWDRSPIGNCVYARYKKQPCLQRAELHGLMEWAWNLFDEVHVALLQAPPEVMAQRIQKSPQPFTLDQLCKIQTEYVKLLAPEGWQLGPAVAFSVINSRLLTFLQ